MSYKSLIFAVFMPRKEKIANTFVSAMLNSNGAVDGIRTHTSRTLPPEDSASTNSATTALIFLKLAIINFCLIF